MPAVRHWRGEVGEPPRRQAHEAIVAHAVIAALELQDLVTLHVGARDAHRVEIGFRARRNEPHLLRAGYRRDDLLGELDAVRIVDEERGAVRELRQHRGLDLGMRMADQHGTRAQQVVDVLVS